MESIDTKIAKCKRDALAQFRAGIRSADWNVLKGIAAVFHASGNAHDLWREVVRECAHLVTRQPWAGIEVFQCYDAWRGFLDNPVKTTNAHNLASSRHKMQCAVHLFKAIKILVEPNEDAMEIAQTHSIPFRHDRPRDMDGLAAEIFDVARTEPAGTGKVEWMLKASKYAQSKHGSTKCLHIGCDMMATSVFKVHIVKPLIDGLAQIHGKRFRGIAKRMYDVCERGIGWYSKEWIQHFIMWSCGHASPPEPKPSAKNPFTLASRQEKEPQILAKSEVADVFEDGDPTHPKRKWAKCYSLCEFEAQKREHIRSNGISSILVGDTDRTRPSDDAADEGTDRTMLSDDPAEEDTNRGITGIKRKIEKDVSE